MGVVIPTLRRCLPLLFLLMSSHGIAQEAPAVALITTLRGAASLQSQQGRQPLQAFVKVKHGDVLSLSNARLQIIYFENGRQEIWQGSGRLEILASESKAFGLAAPEIKILPSPVAKQIARAPALDNQGRIVTLRVRAIASTDAIAKLESTYRQMRMEAVRDDLNPELYLLSGLFEMRELERVEQVLNDLQQSRPGNTEVGVLTALYRKALKNMKEARAG